MGEIFGKGWGIASRDGVIVGFDGSSSATDITHLAKGWVADYDAEHGYSALKVWDSSRPTTMNFTIQDINPEALRLLYGADLFDTQEDYTRMTTTANSKAGDFEPGDKVKLVDASTGSSRGSHEARRKHHLYGSYLGREGVVSAPGSGGVVYVDFGETYNVDCFAWRLEKIEKPEGVFVHDRDGLSALPTSTKIRLVPGTEMRREANGAWEWRDSLGEYYYGNVTKSAFRDDWFPVEVLNPELMGEFKAVDPKFVVGQQIVGADYARLPIGSRTDLIGRPGWLAKAGGDLWVTGTGHRYTTEKVASPIPRTLIHLGDGTYEPEPRPLRVGDKITNERFGELPINSVIYQPNNLGGGYASHVLRTAVVKTGPGGRDSGGGAFLVTGESGYKYAKGFSGEYEILQLGGE